MYKAQALKLKKRGVLRHTRTYAVASLKKSARPVRSKKGKETGIIVLFEELVGANRALEKEKGRLDRGTTQSVDGKQENGWSSWVRAQRRRVGD